LSSDDLNAPLGQDKKKKSRLGKLSALAPQVLAGVLGLFGLAVAVWGAFVNDPLGGQPVAVVSTTPSKPGAPTAMAGGDKEHAHHDGTAGSAASAAANIKIKKMVPPGSTTVTIIDGSSGKSHDVIIPGKSSNAAPNASIDAKMLEMTRHGSIPKIGPDGTRPYARYAEKRAIPTGKKDWPRIALIISGLGISASGTADALAELPAPVSFALAPYGADLKDLAAQAREKKHEVLLQVPMEPFNFPDNDPGPQTLMTSLSATQNIDRLHWLMSRFEGYVGLISYMGGKFTASEEALAPVLREASTRGLIYVDDGTSPRSVAGQIAGAQNLPFVKADIVVDTVPTPTEIDQALARLELIARERGRAIGLATALPATVKRIAAWAKAVEARGFVLVPITMMAVREKSS
jgi:polysaccharide deacetylase 2 family uncharacterized protein YibQ